MANNEPSEHITWRDMLARTTDIVGDRITAKWLCEHASGCDADEFREILDELVSQRCGLHLDDMMRRFLGGEPLQYVMGRWQFRHIDLMVDRRVLIPRPETELIVDIARQHLVQLRPPFVIVDLGTGSGAIGLSLLHELPLDSTTVYMTDASSDAIDVVRANATGIGRRATGARFAVGEWWAALPEEIAGTVDVVVSNPPYIAEDDPEVEQSVNAWEPHDALFAGDDGLDDIRVIVRDAPQWLRPGGMLVVEMGYTQADGVAQLFTNAGFENVQVHTDLAGLNRFVSGIARPH